MRSNKHNPEGYLDLTAYKAIYGAPKPGEVWKCERKDGKIVEELIIRNHGDVSTCLVVIDNAMENCITVKARPGCDLFRYVNPQMLHYVFNKKLQLFVKRVPDDDFARIIDTIRNTLDLDSIGGSANG